MHHVLYDHTFCNSYTPVSPADDSRILCYHGRTFLARFCAEAGTGLSFITYKELQKVCGDRMPELTYYFRLDDTAFFCCTEELDAGLFPGTAWHNVSTLRGAAPKEYAFVCITGHQLFTWYRRRQFCPACGKPMHHSGTERAMVCGCGVTEYPKICPAVIVAICHGDKLLLTRYTGRTGFYALVAGYAEIGESIEDTVHREVMEETGLKVKELVYYKSQPWSFSDTLLFGFWCQLDGDDTVTLQEEELSGARWVSRSELPEDDGVSLTREMIRMFREGKDPFSN